jgi:hypothetical protein
MQGQHPPDTTMIHGEGVTGLDDPGEFTGGEGVRERQADNLLLDWDRHVHFNRGLPTAMRERASSKQAGEAIAAKPLQIAPETLIRQARDVALLSEGALALAEGAKCLIAG